MTRMQVAYLPEEDCIMGSCLVSTEVGHVPVIEVERVGDLADKLAVEMLKREMKRQGISRDEVGFFGWIKKTWRKIKRTARRIARKIKIKKVFRKIGRTVKKVGRVMKKVVTHPAVAAGVGVLSAAVPGVGPVIGAAYAGVRSAIHLVDNLQKGNPRAIQKVAQYALDRSARGRRAMALIQSVQPRNAYHGHNPWLMQAMRSLGGGYPQFLLPTPRR